jgi:hypothetical protein
MRTIAALAAATLLASATAATPAQAKVNPETNAKLGPTESAGHYLSYPTPTYQWHGCKLTARAEALDNEEIPGAPAFRKGTRQSAVTFTVNPTQPYISWKVKAGYTICGVQASVLLGRADDDTLHLAEIGYTSSRTKGSTVTSGGETIKVKIPKDEPDEEVRRTMGGKTYDIASPRDITVFVKKKK